MKLEVKIEIKSVVKKATSQPQDGSPDHFIVLVRGVNGNQIEHFVKQVVFHLPSRPKLVKTSPPYMITGTTHASFRLPIDIYLHTSDARNKVSYSYCVYLSDKPVENAVNVKTLTFLNTPPDFRQRLLRGGAEVVKESNSATIETQVKSEPVERTENQNGPLENERNAEPELVANKEAAISENNTFKENVEHLVGKTEPTEDASVQNDILNELPNICVRTKDTSEQDGILLIQDIYSFDDLMKDNEVLKKENEELLQKFTKHEGIIASYIEKLPALQNDCSAATTDLSQLQKKSEDIEAEISSLKSAIHMLMSEKSPQKDEVNEVKRKKNRRRKRTVVHRNK